MAPKEFLDQWVSHHINSGTQESDAEAIAMELVSDASMEGIDREALEVVTGKSVEKFVIASIRQAIEEEIL
jgi:hypothetical protein